MGLKLGSLTLSASHLFVIGGTILGLGSVGLGIAGIVDPPLLSLHTGSVTIYNFGLYECDQDICTKDKFRTVQGLITAGVGAILVGVFIAVTLSILIKNLWVQLLSLVFSYGGPAVIVIGLLLYAKYVFEDITRFGAGSTQSVSTLKIERSMIFIVVSCLAGFLAAICFTLSAGLLSHHTTHHRSSKVVIDRTQRF